MIAKSNRVGEGNSLEPNAERALKQSILVVYSVTVGLVLRGCKHGFRWPLRRQGPQTSKCTHKM